MKKVSSRPGVPSGQKKQSLLRQLRQISVDALEQRIDKIRMRKAKTDIDAALAKHKTVAISSLTLKEVEKSLRLRLDKKDCEFQRVELIPPPQLLLDQLRLIAGASSRSASTEASIRWTIDALLLNARSIAASRTHGINPINIQAERSYSYGPVSLRGASVMLSAKPDYGAWYGKDEAVELNVVIVEAKKTDLESGVAQALGYMGCIHRERKRFPKRDCTVYGLATNGVAFPFLKISNASRWSEHIVTLRSCEIGKPLGILVHMFCRAALMSPTHSKESSHESHCQEGSEDSVLLETLDEDEEMDDLFD
ncbi:hypothetical protein N7535_006026 [Penicillium sp. DV-2018c]|nr:hypothetical protein N7461_009605 [Penicillium sp. DV-2018c]KAJ5572366.1 hypothetical protein N7535_006026 [Penicillium sp. DV-2018c]